MLATSSPKTESQVKAMLDELRAALAKCQHDFSISFEGCHTRFELQLQEEQKRVEALIVGLKTQFVTSIRDPHANLTREYNQGVSKVSEQLNSRCEALTKNNEDLKRKIASLEASIPGLIEERVSTFKASLEAMQKKIANVEGTMSKEVARAVDAMPPPPPPPDHSASHSFVMQQVEKVESRVSTLESLEPVTTALRRIDAIEECLGSRTVDPTFSKRVHDMETRVAEHVSFAELVLQRFNTIDPRSLSFPPLARRLRSKPFVKALKAAC